RQRQTRRVAHRRLGEEVERVQPDLGRLLDDGPGELLPLVPLVGRRPHHGLGEIVNPLLDLQLILVQLEGEVSHPAMLPRGNTRMTTAPSIKAAPAAYGAGTPIRPNANPAASGPTMRASPPTAWCTPRRPPRSCAPTPLVFGTPVAVARPLACQERVSGRRRDATTALTAAMAAAMKNGMWGPPSAASAPMAGPATNPTPNAAPNNPSRCARCDAGATSVTAACATDTDAPEMPSTIRPRNRTHTAPATPVMSDATAVPASHNTRTGLP